MAMLTFSTNAGSDPATTQIPFGAGTAVVTRTGTGAYRVRFAAGIWSSGARVIGRGAFLSAAAATGNRAHTGPTTFNADGTTDLVVITVDNTGAAVDIAAAANNIVSVLVAVDEASV